MGRGVRSRWWSGLLGVLAVVLSLGGIVVAPASALADNDAITRTWSRTDAPVGAGKIARTWVWGPALTDEIQETALDAPGGTRTVRYFDKSRMEVPTDPNADPSSPWYITNGLLARELVTGSVQVGNDDFEQHDPAGINVAGDANDPNGPTYASFLDHLDDSATPNGWLITQRIARDGTVTDDPSLGMYGVTAHHRVSVPGIDHQVASVFWEFMTSSGTIYENGRYRTGTLFPEVFYVTGLPIAEPYWADVRVGGTAKLVLVQVFERRVLTYTPDNPIEWRVEAGNVGQHYYAWRYGSLPSAQAPQIPLPTEPVSNFMDTLHAELDVMVAGWDGWNAVTVTDLQTGRTVSVHGDRQQPSACTIKVFIMIAVAQDIEAGKYTPTDVQDLVLSAMGPSNTPPAYELIRIVGGGDVSAGVRRINGIMQGLGMTRSVLRHPPSYPDIDHGYGTGDNYLTTDEMNMALGKLYRGETGLSKWGTDYVLWSMTLATPGQQYSLGGPLPDGTVLYHKIGLIYDDYQTWNDAGIVVFQRGDQTYAYVISYLGSYSSDWHNSYYHGAAVSGAAWRAFSNEYQ